MQCLVAITDQKRISGSGSFVKASLIKEIYHNPDRLCQGSQKTPRSQSIRGAIGFMTVATINEDVEPTLMCLA